MKTALLLHRIRSTHNVGSMFRSADGAGVSKIFLSGYTPRPVDRFGREQKDIAKTALGAEKSVSWEYYSSPAAVIEKMVKEEIEKLEKELFDLIPGGTGYTFIIG